MLREIDLNAVRREAEMPWHLAVIGGRGSGKSTLISQLLKGPCQLDLPAIPPVSEHNLDEEIPLHGYSLVLILLDGSTDSHQRERELLKDIRKRNLPVVVCYNKADLVTVAQPMMNEAQCWDGAPVVATAAYDRKSVQDVLARAILQSCKGCEVRIARSLPGMREPVVRKLVDDTCFINCAYSLTTGLAEINILLDLPLNLADILILTKNQALMAYKIALAMGQPPDWKETIPKLSAVVGSAFIWRQIARQLVGLIPAYGVIPKMAVAYAGTYAVGQAIYQWCAHGEKMRPDTLKSLYVSAFSKGKEYARSLLAKRKGLRSRGLLKSDSPA
jgi:uncharacterized protein (DUF697 family)